MFFKTQKSTYTSAKEDRAFLRGLAEKQHREAITKYPELANQTWLRAVWDAMLRDHRRRPATKKESVIENAVLFLMMMIPFVVGIHLLWSTWWVLLLALAMSFVAWHFIRHSF